MSTRSESFTEIMGQRPNVEAPGARGIELHVNTTPSGRARPDYPGELAPHHGLRLTPEISYGIARNWDGGLYLPFVRGAEGTVFTLTIHNTIRQLTK